MIGPLTLEHVLRSLSEVGSTILLILLGTFILEALIYLVLGKILKSNLTLPYMLLAPAAVGLLFLVVYPIAFEVRLAFTNMSLRAFRDPQFIGLQNFVRVFTEPILQQAMFLPVLVRTILWTAANVFFHVTGGMILALLLNRPLRGRGLYRTLLVFPWAIPQVIAVLAWRGEFQFQFGFINVMLTRLGLQPIQWIADPFWNFVAMLIVNIWLGIPFMMIIILGGLQSISQEYYDAAKVDGAAAWQQFRNITLPLLRPVLVPATVLGVIWTFNNFNVPFIINQNELETSDILVTALFRAAFEYNRYGFSAAFALVIFAILFIFSALYIRRSGLLKGIYE